MIRRKLLLLILFFGLSVFYSSVCAQTEEDSVAISTPFRKGRWLTGLSGNITSGNNSLDSTQSGGFTSNRYSIDFRTGKFVKNRFLAGGIFMLSRDNSEAFIKRTLETLYIGPIATWYFTDGEQGSLFVSGSGGFTSFRDESTLDQNGVFARTLVDGNGVGALVRFGYSYVLHDRIAFDLGLSFNQSWLYAEVTENPGASMRNEAFTVSDLSFSFGFSVILDSFFF